MALTSKQKEDVLREIFSSEKIQLRCGKHRYFGPIKGHPEVTPFMGCPDCWKVFFVSELASTPPDERAQKLDEIEEVLHKMVEMIEAGTWDLELYPHAQVEFGEE
jgi:hypothetical protein